ncbi:ABC transporter ATP-binding protein [Tropicimonas sp. IMCC34043]|uniref:ABC transporter ATP-binding protein n=1 Tax=Tropicimonas sp. IMCC34043 TaxID=2248760 RepID=UPI000E222313|nr:ATP-binding cassette domain-containing protein [Tropicimonas sp. IMCC34043]
MTLPLEVMDLEVRRPGGRVLLSVPRLTIAPGSLIGIKGPTGAGKSTLLFALAGLLETCSGRVAWGDTDLLAIGAERRARFRAAHIGIVFQDFLLFEELDALGNAALTQMFRPRGERAALRHGAKSRLTDLGLQELDRSVSSFSGGERQRVSVARAMAGDAGVILADEPTASLDRAAADRLIDDLAALARNKGKTLIAVSHDANLHARMDRVLAVQDGRILDEAAT